MPLSVRSNWHTLPIRLLVGFGFIQQGYAKLSRGPDDIVAVVYAMGLPFADLLGSAIIAVKLLGSAVVLLGALLPLAAVPMIVAHRRRATLRPV